MTKLHKMAIFDNSCIIQMLVALKSDTDFCLLQWKDMQLNMKKNVGTLRDEPSLKTTVMHHSTGLTTTSLPKESLFLE